MGLDLLLQFLLDVLKLSCRLSIVILAVLCHLALEVLLFKIMLQHRDGAVHVLRSPIEERMTRVFRLLKYV